MEKGRVPYKGDVFGLRVRPGKPACNAHSRPHAEAGVNHVQRMGVSKGIAAYVPRENRICLNCLYFL